MHKWVWWGHLIRRGRPGGRWDKNIEMDFQEMGWEALHWIDLVEDRVKWWALLTAVMNLLVP